MDNIGTPPIHQRRHIVPGWSRFLFLLPAAMAALGLYAISHKSHDLLAGGPLLSLLFYSMLVLVTTWKETQVTPQSFTLQFGPLPTGVPREAHPKEAILHLFPRYIREVVGKGLVEHRYYAAVEISDGRWLNILGHYPDWAGASQACQELAKCWGLSQIAAGRHGFPKKTDWRSAQSKLLWGATFIAAFLWGAFAEIRL
jgi:hypothetical protein